jgi:hypothetical protein
VQPFDSGVAETSPIDQRTMTTAVVGQFRRGTVPSLFRSGRAERSVRFDERWGVSLRVSRPADPTPKPRRKDR